MYSEEKVHNRFRYTGQQYDPITQQYYLRARYYNPVIARFTQEDTYHGDGLNLYSYCHNNPLTYYDPSGYDGETCRKGNDNLEDKGVQNEGGSNFRNQDLLDSHYNKHGKEFGNITKGEYLQGANDLINSTSDTILTKTRDNGDIIYYNPITNEFAVKSADGYIRTYFKPSNGIDYFNRQ